MNIKKFLKSGHWPTLLSSFLYFDISFMVWVLAGVLASFIARDFCLSATQKGLLAAVPILGGALVRIPLGICVDHIGAKKTGLLAQGMVILPLLGIWLLSHDFYSLIVLGLFLGIAGGSFAVALPLASRAYPPQCQGAVMGIAGAGNSGTVLASLFAPVLAEWFGWRNVFGLMLIPVLLVLIVFTLLVKEAPLHGKMKKMKDYFLVLRQADTFWFCLFYGVTFGGFVGLASFLGVFLYDQYGLSKMSAGYFTALCVFSGSFVRPIGGYLADRWGGLHMLTLFLGCISLFLFGVSFIGPFPLTIFFLFLAMAALGLGNGAIFQLVPQRFPKEIGVMTGIVGAAGALGGFFLPTLLGFFKDATGSYGVGFILFSFMSLAALIILNVVQKEWKMTWLSQDILLGLEAKAVVETED